MHLRFQAKWVSRGARVLEVGAGPGRFTVELARLGARVLVSDISTVQLAANARHVGEAGVEEAVDGRVEMDVTDLSSLADGSFEIATAFGGPLSYVFDSAPTALRELLRVVVPGGLVLISVMSRWGATHQFLDSILDEQRSGYRAAHDVMIAQGDLLGEQQIFAGMTLPHECHLFTWEELHRLFSEASCEVVDAMASGYISLRAEETLAALEPDEWKRLMDWEELACRSAGVVGAGTHIIVALRTPLEVDRRIV
ncbi:MAG: class I SAM-dependent methyltransferase [Candidatus Dormibacteria bacterium]